MLSFFHELFYRPLFNGLIFLYDAFPFHDMGVAVILLTVFIRIVLLPLFYKAAKNQALLQRLAPKLKELQEKHKNNREAQAKAMFALYREHRVNPMTGFLLLLVQLPILFALYRVFIQGFAVINADDLYPFVASPTVLNPNFLGAIDLASSSIGLAILVGISQYFLGRLTAPPPAAKTADDFGTQMARQMVYMGPLLVVFIFIFLKLPTVIGIYWLTTNLFSIVQQVVINRKLTPLAA